MSRLTESQRSMIAGKLAKLKVGGDGGNQHTGGKGPIGPPTLEQAADMLNVGVTSVKRAKQVLVCTVVAIQRASG